MFCYDARLFTTAFVKHSIYRNVTALERITDDITDDNPDSRFLNV